MKTKAILAAAVICGGLFYANKYVTSYVSTSSHSYAAKQYWVEQADAIKSKQYENTPFNNKVNFLEFSIGDDTQHLGKYYFESYISVNHGRSIPMMTVVESIEGKWRVNEEDTLNSLHSAALNQATKILTHNITTAQQYFGNNETDKRQLTPVELRAIDKMIDEQFVQFKETFKQAYIDSIQ